jgi:hypothetical protein
MKKFQKLFASMMLTFVVALSTFAGDINYWRGFATTATARRIIGAKPYSCG